MKGLLTDKTKKDIAAAESISASAVSQRAGRDGLDLIVVASRYLRSVPCSAAAVMSIAMGIADVSRRLIDRAWVPAVVVPPWWPACATRPLPRSGVSVTSSCWSSRRWRASPGTMLCAQPERTGDRELTPLVVFGLGDRAAHCVVGRQF